MNCKDCLHFEVCESISKRQSLATLYYAEDCPCFTDKSEWVHLPAKVGDTLYKICPQGTMCNGKIVTNPCQRCPWQNCQCFNIGYQKDMKNIIQPIKINSRRFISDIEPYIGKIWFTDKESAEKALEEMKKK